jgi:hypothetical protein
MRRLIVACCIALAGLSPASARASFLAWEGTLSLALFGSSPLSVAVSGVGVAADTGNGVTLGTLRPLGTAGGTVTHLVTDPEAAASGLFAVQLQVDEIGFGTLAPFNPPAPEAQLQLGQAELGVRGLLRFCFLTSRCDTGLAIPLSSNRAATGLGVGGTMTGTFASAALSIEAAPWTVRSAAVTYPTEQGATVTAVTEGSLHGAYSFTGSTAITGGELSLVTPLRLQSLGSPAGAGFARLSIRFLPEPGGLLLLGAGLGGLAGLHRIRSRGEG